MTFSTVCWSSEETVLLSKSIPQEQNVRNALVMVTEHEGRARSCVGGGVGGWGCQVGVLEKVLQHRLLDYPEFRGTRKGHRAELLDPHRNGLPWAVGTALSCQSSGSIRTVLSDIGTGFWVHQCGARGWIQRSLWTPSHSGMGGGARTPGDSVTLYAFYPSTPPLLQLFKVKRAEPAARKARRKYAAPPGNTHPAEISGSICGHLLTAAPAGREGGARPRPHQRDGTSVTALREPLRPSEAQAGAGAALGGLQLQPINGIFAAEPLGSCSRAPSHRHGAARGWWRLWTTNPGMPRAARRSACGGGRLCHGGAFVTASGGRPQR